MTFVACFLLLLTFSIAGQATPTSSPATGPAARSAGVRGPSEPRTSRSSSHHRWLPRLQGTGLQPEAPPVFAPGERPSPDVLGGLDLSTAAPSQVAEDGPSAPHTQPASSSIEYYKVDRRPYGSLKNNRALKAKADREKQARQMRRIKGGVLKDKKKPDGSTYAAPTFEEFKAGRRARSKQRRSSLTEEARAKMNQIKNERSRKAKAKRRAQQKAQKEGRTWQGSPVRPLGRPRQNWEEDQVGVGAEEVPQHVPADTRMEEAAPHRAVGVPSASRGRRRSVRSRAKKAAVAVGSSSQPAFAFPPDAPPQTFLPGPFSSVDTRLSLSAPGSSKSPQRQMTHAPPAAPTSDNDGLRLTLAPPRHD